MSMKKKAALSALLCVLLVAAMGVAGTLAWLSDRISAANTFTWGDIGLGLEETDTGLDEDEDPRTNSYEIAPGLAVFKDPVVTLEAESAACWLYVRLEESAGFDSVMSYSMASGWQLLQDDGSVSVWWRKAQAADEACEFHVIADDKLVVTSDEDAIRALDAQPSLSVDAYAVQLEGVESAAEGWKLVSNQSAN